MLSIVVPAYNEERLIARTLAAIFDAIARLGVASEVIVVDDGSTDRTAAIARELGASVVSVEKRQISATRNAGARASSGDMLLFVDADTTVTSEAVRAACEAMRNGAAGGGSAFRFDRPLPVSWRLIDTLGVPLYRIIKMASGCFLFCTRQAFEATGGFDESMYAGEEGRMSRALGRVGRFVVLRESVTTSGRKMRAYSKREIFADTLRSRPGKGQRTRRGKDLWYGERRPDPIDS